ncbi:unnamed protein product [Brachionus calyciflorus]|uniref:Tc1-like transposase DDE domain-containing protein n=1 Tax=Brachionus calyciflorus TaxID=104777 RepID=A0A814T2S2_9BILA|nr:unnamed protein product [Brachionus calyciflorus]
MGKDRTPAYSPDLNPIEDLRSDMKDFVRKKLCKTNEEINKAIQEYHSNLTPEKCQKFISKLKKVIPVVIERLGEWSDM